MLSDRDWQNGTMKATRRAGSLPALAFSLAFIVAACGSSGATPTSGATSSPSAVPSAAATPGGSAVAANLAAFAKIEAQVEAIRGLTPTAAVTPVLLDSAAIGAKLAEINTTQMDHAALASESTLLVHLGMLPAGSDLEKLQTALNSSQVVGFYDSGSKGLYVLSEGGAVGAMEKFVFSHEYTHALQDQAFGLDKLDTGAADQTDRGLARVALVEGDATLLMSSWAATGLSPLELLAIAGQSMSDEQGALLAASPAILRDTLTFPYEDGLAFVQRIYQEGGWAAVNAVYSKPPNSSSQILHPELYQEGVQPVAVTVPEVPASLSGWKLTMQDTLGEFVLRTWLRTGPTGLDKPAAQASVDGWGGDRVGLYEGPNGAWAVLLRTTWRTDGGRTSFAAAAETMLAGLGVEYRVCGVRPVVEVAIVSDAALGPDFIDCNTMG
jgi:hypothetical protein